MNKKKFTNLLIRRETIILIAIILLMIVMFFTRPDYFTFANLRASLINFCASITLAVGMGFLLIGRNFDLSIGAIMVFIGSVANLLFRNEMNGYLALFISFIAATLCGALNGLVVSKLKVNSFITTLATMGIFQSSGVLLFTRIRTVTATPQVTVLGDSKLLGIESYVWFTLFIVLVLGLLLSKNKFFRQIYYMGGNPYYAGLFGINTSRLTFLLFVIMGMLAGIAGIILILRLRMGTPDVGSFAALDAVVACILGGVSLSGGKGNIFGIVLGSIFILLIRTSMVFWGFSPEYHKMVLGILLILAVSADVLRKRGPSGLGTGFA